MSKAQLFVKYHGGQIITIFILAVAAISWRVIDEDLIPAKKDAGQVMGEASVNEEPATEENSQLIVS